VTFMKSILLGSAAGLVAVAAAQAADLPTRKSAPAEYVKVCNVGGMAGFVLPGSDTCFKISGSVVAQVSGGNLNKGYTWVNATGAALSATAPSSSWGVTNGAPIRTRPDFGMGVRGTVQFDARQDTAFGVLRGFIETQFNDGSGYQGGGPGAGVLINYAYLQWAGLTLGKANSFFSFYGGGEDWDNLISPDQQGYNQPVLFAYTATFGGGFSATIAAQNPIAAAGVAGGTQYVSPLNATLNGARAPDFVVNVRIDQAWGAAQLSGVAHNVYASSAATNPASTQNVWGWGVNGGVKFNLPSFGSGDNIQFQATWTRNAAWFSGLPDAFGGEAQGIVGSTATGAGLGPNGNGLGPVFLDTWNNGDGTWATPTAWSVSGLMEHHFSPTVWLGPEFAYGEQHWSGLSPMSGIPVNTQAWEAGATLHWDPVPHLDFSFEMLYEAIHQSTPVNGGTAVAPISATHFPNDADGFEGRILVTRDF
jgi:Porin subfamily